MITNEMIDFNIDKPKLTPFPHCLLSILIPVFNEEEVLPELQQRLMNIISTIDGEVEIIYIDDGSSDSTPLLLHQFKQQPRVGVIQFSRNFGKEQAMCAGLKAARGNAVVLLDADLQDPPELIPAMLQLWQQGADVVNMQRLSRQGDSWVKRVTAYTFYRIINTLSEIPIERDVGDFRLLSRRAVDALNQISEQNRFMKGLFSWIGFEQRTLKYHRDARLKGKTKWRYFGLWKFALEGITGFSTAPLKVASYLGFLSSVTAFCYAFYFLAKTLLLGESVKGFPTLIVTNLFFFGVQLMALGILGEYIGRLFIESKRRPLYIVSNYHPAYPVSEVTTDLSTIKNKT